MRVKLIKKLALVLNGVDLTPYRVGEEFDCSERDGRMLILEEWAEFVELSNDDGFEIEEPAGTLWEIIDEHRDGQKDRLA